MASVDHRFRVDVEVGPRPLRVEWVADRCTGCVMAWEPDWPRTDEHYQRETGLVVGFGPDARAWVKRDRDGILVAIPSGDAHIIDEGG